MKQSRLASFLESCGNTATGFALSLLFQWIVLVLIKGLPMTWWDNIEFALIMTVISIMRSFTWRRLMEALHIRVPMSPGMIAIIAERQRQKDVEGWTAEHDLAHRPGELAQAGACYALANRNANADSIKALWPWSWSWWKATDQRRNLIKAGALILAELDRSDYERKNKRAA